MSARGSWSPTPPSSAPTRRSPRPSPRCCGCRPPRVRPPGAGGQGSRTGWDAVILGSAIYAAHWQRDARRFATRFGAQLAERPLWLFSSGPLDPWLARARLPITQHGAEITEGLGARDHRTFGGRLRRTRRSIRRCSRRTPSGTSATGTRSVTTPGRSRPPSRPMPPEAESLRRRGWPSRRTSG